MKRSHKTAAGIAAALSLGIAAAAFAQPGQMGGGHGSHDTAGMQHGMMGGMQRGKMGGHSLMTPEERQKIAQAAREAMQKRAEEKGATAQSDTHTH